MTADNLLTLYTTLMFALVDYFDRSADYNRLSAIPSLFLPHLANLSLAHNNLTSIDATLRAPELTRLCVPRIACLSSAPT